MNPADEIGYLDMLREFLVDQYARTHDNELVQLIAAITERSHEIIEQAHGRPDID